MSEEEKVYQFNEYVLGYDKGKNDRSCLTISKIQNDNMYVMSSLYDGSADVISLMLDNLSKEIERLNNIIDELEKYINEEYTYDEVGMKIFDASTLQDKLRELKEGK